jgi:hypothetical protein
MAKDFWAWPKLKSTSVPFPIVWMESVGTSYTRNDATPKRPFSHFHAHLLLESITVRSCNGHACWGPIFSTSATRPFCSSTWSKRRPTKGLDTRHFVWKPRVSGLAFVASGSDPFCHRLDIGQGEWTALNVSTVYQIDQGWGHSPTFKTMTKNLVTI